MFPHGCRSTAFTLSITCLCACACTTQQRLSSYSTHLLLWCLIQLEACYRCSTSQSAVAVRHRLRLSLPREASPESSCNRKRTCTEASWLLIDHDTSTGRSSILPAMRFRRERGRRVSGAAAENGQCSTNLSCMQRHGDLTVEGYKMKVGGTHSGAHSGSALARTPP